MKVKICGICRAADARAAVEAGADYVGVILAARGPRQQTAAAAAALYEAAAGAARVGVFADQPADDVAQIAKQLHLDVIQLHGVEPAAYVAGLAARAPCAIWKSVFPHTADDLVLAIAEYAPHVQGVLLDSGAGTGRRFDWSLATGVRALLPARMALIVAGGLRPENVSDAVAALRPDVVDVASGVERAVCEKDVMKVRAFVRNARS